MIPIPSQPPGSDWSAALQFLGPLITGLAGGLLGWFGALFSAPARLQSALDAALRTLMSELQSELARRSAQNDVLTSQVEGLEGERRQLQQKLDSWERIAAAKGWREKV